MEAIFFLIDIIAVILLLYWSIINDQRDPDAPTIGIFAYRRALRPPTPAGQRRTAASSTTSHKGR
ncbi:hypothetical protein [Pelagibius sp.]|uniref:hypothetical protein n=1 Tax=Pelagibius sp. TaxID=1931238 RepID=UPI00262CE437|nr:hypothetical protein [Pelagibius sp.]